MIFSFNDAGAKGGSICVNDGSQVNVSASVIQNSSSVRGGGAMPQFNSVMRVTHGTCICVCIVHAYTREL